MDDEDDGPFVTFYGSLDDMMDALGRAMSDAVKKYG